MYTLRFTRGQMMHYALHTHQQCQGSVRMLSEQGVYRSVIEIDAVPRASEMQAPPLLVSVLRLLSQNHSS